MVRRPDPSPAARAGVRVPCRRVAQAGRAVLTVEAGSDAFVPPELESPATPLDHETRSPVITIHWPQAVQELWSFRPTLTAAPYPALVAVQLIFPAPLAARHVSATRNSCSKVLRKPREV